MKSIRLLYVLIAASPFWVSNASEIFPGTIELGPYAGYQFLDDFSGNRPKDNLIYGLRAGIFVTEKDSFEAAYQTNFTETERVSASNADFRLSSFRFNLLHHLLPSKKVNPFLTLGVGWLQADIEDAATRNELGVNVGTGLKIMVSDRVGIRLDGRYVYAEVADAHQHNFEGALGLSFFFGGEAALDQDSDGVPDKKDQCAATPNKAKVDQKGCPSDADGDGVFDGIDACPATMKGLIVDLKGCPQDSDGDKVPDGPDECPNTPEGVRVSGSGCAFDDDKDGVANEIDKCPDTQEGLEVNELGCLADADGDGVNDSLDLCPDTPETTPVDPKGCPTESVSRGVLKDVNFKTGSAQLTPNSKTILNGVAKELNAFSQVRVEVQGHTDSTGSAGANQAISTKRAEAVMNYLISQGVDKSRLLARGYGEDQPIASNANKVGRAQNRRVELKWLD